MDVTRTVLPVMRKQRSGHIVTITSTGGIMGQEFCSAYSTQDFGLLQTMVGAVTDAAREADANLWRRYFVIALQGLRPEGAPLERLPAPPLPPNRMEELLVGQWKQRKR